MYYKTEKKKNIRKRKKKKTGEDMEEKNRKKNRTRVCRLLSVRDTRPVPWGRASAISRELDYLYMGAVHRADIRPIYMVYTEGNISYAHRPTHVHTN